jgi:hypothetical protein
MRSTDQAENHRSVGRPVGRPGAASDRPMAPSGTPALPSGTPALPSWESFPVAERHQVVRVILWLARRQAVARPPGDLARVAKA